MDISESAPVLRIGELSQRLGVSDHVLRAWERRYGLLRPGRLPATASELAGTLREALDAFDEPAAQAILDRLVSDLSVPALARAAPLVLAGAGATPRLAAAVGARLPDGDAVTAASAIGRLL